MDERVAQALRLLQDHSDEEQPYKPTVADPYNAQANEMRTQATGLESQAAPPPAAHGLGVLGEVIRAGLEGFTGGYTHGPGYFEHQQARDTEEHQRQQDLLTRAKGLRGEAVGQQQLGQTEELRQGQEQDRLTQAQHYQDEQKHQAALEAQAAENAKNKVEFAPPGSQPFKGGAPFGETIPKETPEKSLQSQEVELIKGGHQAANFNPTTGRYYEPSTGADITSTVKGHWQQPPGGGFEQSNPSAPDETVDYIAKQVQKDPLNWTLAGGNKTLENQVRNRLAKGGADVNRMTSANRQLGETSSILIPKIDKVIEELSNPEIAKNLGPLMGRWNEFMTGKIGSNDPKLSNLRSTLALIQTGAMRAHVGARGSGELLKKFEGLVNGKQMDAQTLAGSLTGIRDFLSGYAENIKGNFDNQAPSGKDEGKPFITPGGPIDRLLKGGG